MSVTVEVVTDIAASAATVFDLELDMDVHAASLAGHQERVRTSTGRPQLGLGDVVTLRARHFGVTWRMTSQVVELDRPHRFVDVQVAGPFRRFRHEHVFVPTPGGTRMTDRVAFTAPLGAPGAAVGRLVVGPYLRRLLQQRGAHVRSVAEGQEGRPAPLPVPRPAHGAGREVPQRSTQDSG
jgi:ligand-binding SRPBCC domain-containing protein